MIDRTCAAAALVCVSLLHPAIARSRSDPLHVERMMIGRSTEGRAIFATETGDFDAPKRILVVGCVHGDEPAGIAVATRLAASIPPAELDLWVIPDLNPDGVAADSRGNAHGVDLNRNFPWRWRPLHGAFDSGSRPLSERESRIAARLVRRVRPSISIWFHQHLDVVDESGGDVAIERRFSKLVGLPLTRLPREPGSAVGWENHTLPGATAFVVELPAGELRQAAVRRDAEAVVALRR